jgi:hypothetical protein
MFYLTHHSQKMNLRQTGRSYFARAGFLVRLAGTGIGAGFPGAIRFKVRSNASGDSSAPSSRAICRNRSGCVFASEAAFFFGAMFGV